MSPRTARAASALLASLLASASGSALAAGYGRVAVPAAGPDPAIQAMVWSPCASPPKTAQLGPYVIRGIPDCAIAGSSLPLVVISHGQGGTFLGHHDTAAALADAGFVVVALNHPGDTFGDDAAAQDLEIFESRPRDASRVISFMLEDWPGHHRLDAGSVGVFGFSRGGYTALALAGAVPDLAASRRRHCGQWWSYAMSLCREMTRKAARVGPRADPRLRAVVVVDPLNLFDGVGLKPVRLPVQLWASEHGGEGVAFEHIEAIRSALPRVPDYHVARGAGHFAYLAPCPPAFKASAPELCDDPPGFDRATWHRTMNSAVTAFFRQHLQSR